MYILLQDELLFFAFSRFIKRNAHVPGVECPQSLISDRTMTPPPFEPILQCHLDVSHLRYLDFTQLD